MHRNCIFCLTLIRDSFFFYCKRRLVQTNVTKLLLTKHNILLVFYLQKGFFSPRSITAPTQFTPLLSFACAGQVKEKKSILKDNYILFACLISSRCSWIQHKRSAASNVSGWTRRPVWWTVRRPLTRKGFVSVYRWQRGLHLASSGSKSCARVSRLTPMHGEPLPVIASDLVNVAAQHLYRFSPLSLTEKRHRNRKTKKDASGWAAEKDKKQQRCWNRWWMCTKLGTFKGEVKGVKHTRILIFLVVLRWWL